MVVGANVLTTSSRRVLVTGGETFVGYQIATALLAEGADVTMLMRPGSEVKLGALAPHVRWLPADVWNPASLRGRARGHGCVVNTVGSLVDDPSHGLSYNRLNFVSARNVINMCVSDGVPHVVLLGIAPAFWIPRQYINAKREAEEYVRRVGMSASLIRAPLVYPRDTPRPLFFALMSALGGIPPLSWLGLRKVAPMPVDVMARAVARIALNTRREKTIYTAADLHRLNSRDELRHGVMADPEPPTLPRPAYGNRAADRADEEVPFGWTPPR
jgi:uncharacterized protein YbjT (DUF2867 family)